jgi:hypothetical protein
MSGDTASAQSITKRNDKSARWIKENCGSACNQGYGESPGQLGAMKAGDLIISSPPYAQARIGQESGQEQCGHNDSYGKTEGQLGSMPPGDLIVSSPPFQNQEPSHAQNETPSKRRLMALAKPGCLDSEYGATKGNIGNSQGKTFWTAARQIVQECYKILRPGSHAVYICKDFIRAGKRVPFSDDWLRLNEDCGFKMVCRHRAMLIKEHEVGDLFEGKKTKSISRKSFFRRLCEAKGSPKIDWEDVICFERA